MSKLLKTTGDVFESFDSALGITEMPSSSGPQDAIEDAAPYGNSAAGEQVNESAEPQGSALESALLACIQDGSSSTSCLQEVEKQFGQEALEGHIDTLFPPKWKPHSGPELWSEPSSNSQSPLLTQGAPGGGFGIDTEQVAKNADDMSTVVGTAAAAGAAVKAPPIPGGNAASVWNVAHGTKKMLDSGKDGLQFFDGATDVLSGSLGLLGNPLLLAASAGISLGKMLDNTFGISDAIAGVDSKPHLEWHSHDAIMQKETVSEAGFPSDMWEEGDLFDVVEPGSDYPLNDPHGLLAPLEKETGLPAIPEQDGPNLDLVPAETQSLLFGETDLF